MFDGQMFQKYNDSYIENSHRANKQGEAHEMRGHHYSPDPLTRDYGCAKIVRSRFKDMYEGSEQGFLRMVGSIIANLWMANVTTGTPSSCHKAHRQEG